MPSVPVLLFDATLPELVTMPTPNEMVMEPPEAVLPLTPSIVTAPLLVLPSPEARVKIPLLLVDDDPEMIGASPPATTNKSPAFTLNAPPMLVPEPTEIAMLPPEPDADKTLLISRVPLLPMLTVPVFNNESPNTPAVPALLVNTVMLPEFVTVPTPNEIVMEPPEAVLPLTPSIVTAPPLMFPSPEARVKLPPLLVDDDSEMIGASPPAGHDKLPAVTLNAPPMLVPEPTEIAMQPSKPDVDKQLPISKVPLLTMLAVPVFINRSPNTPAVPALLVNTAMLPKLVAVPTPDEMVMEPSKAILQLLPSIVTVRLRCHLPRPESSSRHCWSLTIQK
jgi:hypothetical protein